jgi:hypothetical protein
MKYLSFLFVVTALFMMSCSQDNQLDSVSALRSDSPADLRKELPFKTHAKAVVTSLAPGAPCSGLRVDIVSEGQGTYVGLHTSIQHHCINPPSLAFTDGEFTITAADGDQLSGTYFGELVPIAPPIFAINGNFTFTGGTGRFEGATGGGTASGEQDLSTGDATVFLDGTISM